MGHKMPIRDFLESEYFNLWNDGDLEGVYFDGIFVVEIDCDLEAELILVTCRLSEPIWVSPDEIVEVYVSGDEDDD